MDFKCQFCEELFEAKDAYESHLKAEHTAYYYDTYMVAPAILNDLATIATIEAMHHPHHAVANAEHEDGCCCCCNCCCDDDTASAAGDGAGDGDCCDCDDCGDCGDCGDCCSCSIM